MAQLEARRCYGAPAVSEVARRHDWEPPASFDQFAVLGPLGRGGMGHVYLARDVALDRRVALKFIAAAEPGSDARERFLVEARAIARLAHPNVVSIFRIGDVDGRPYIAYEFLEGRGLDAMPKPVDWPTVLRLGVGLARGLAAVHRAGILHRDLKPANLILSDEGTVKLLDFGLAKIGDTVDHARAPESIAVLPERIVPSGTTTTLRPAGSRNEDGEPPRTTDRITRPGTLMGTPAYMAPELWLGEKASTHSDVWALGLVLYELLVGELPFASLPHAQLGAAITTSSVPSVRAKRPDVPQALADVIDRCVRRESFERYASAEQLRQDLEAVHSVFVPLAASAQAPTRDDVAVQESLARITNDDRFTARLYERLFAAHPQLRAMFPADMASQRMKLAHALKLAVDALGRPERIGPLLEELGRRHVAYGVSADQLDALGKVLIETMREHDAAHWDERLEAAWTNAYDRIASAMRRGFVTARSTEVSTELSRILGSEVAYLETDHGHIAHQTVGAARRNDVVVVPGMLSRRDGWSRSPQGASFVRGLLEIGRTILFDRAGLGASDRLPDASHPFVDEEIDHLDVLLDTTSSNSVVLVAIGDGAPIALLYAALRPDRVAGLVVWSGAPSFTDAASITRIEQRTSAWGTDRGASLLGERFAASPRVSSWIAAWERDTATVRHARARGARLARTDVRAVLPFVRVPTLVLHREADPWCPLGGGRAIADAIEGAELEVLPGDAHLPCGDDDERGASGVAARIARFVQEATARRSDATRALGTWLVSDLRPAVLPAQLRSAVVFEEGRRRTMRVDRPGLAARLLVDLAERGEKGRSAIVSGSRGLAPADVAREGVTLLEGAPAKVSVLATPVARALAEGTGGVAFGADGAVARDEFVLGTTPPDGCLEDIGGLVHRTFAIRIEGPRRLSIEGALMPRNPERVLFPHFHRIHAWAAGGGPITIDVRRLEQINSAALGVFVRFIGWIRGEPEERRYPLVLLTDPGVLWQRANLLPLQMIAPEILQIES